MYSEAKIALPTTEFRETETPIQGLRIIEFNLIHDERGTFFEGFNLEKLNRLGVLPPDFIVKQFNITFNHWRALRGIHAGEGHKFVMPLSGEVFGAWVDLREGMGFGNVYSQELKLGQAVIIPQGVGNSFQVTSLSGATYVYLVSENWGTDKANQGLYRGVSAFDPKLKIPWPIDRDKGVIMSPKDQANPGVKDVAPYSFADIEPLK